MGPDGNGVLVIQSFMVALSYAFERAHLNCQILNQIY